MTTHALTHRSALWRYSAWDGLFLALALAHGLILMAWPNVATIALGVWWNSNTIAHNFVHKPFFRSRRLNALFSLYLSMLLGIPQSIWQARHLAHHAGQPVRMPWGVRMFLEVGGVLLFWSFMLGGNPAFFLTEYLPGYVLGLAICGIHGHFEHAGGATISHYGRLYNYCFFNDGYHVEHHARPGAHWRRLPTCVQDGARASSWPAVLRWLEPTWLDAVERLVLGSPRLQRFVLQSHRRAYDRLRGELSGVRNVAIVGGGLFPRTALILRELVPAARLTVIDASRANIELAGRFLGREVHCVHAYFDPETHTGFDLVVVPLAYAGDRDRLYRDPPARLVAIHDWIWRPRGSSVIVSWLLFKRLNLISPAAAAAADLTERRVRICR